VAGWLRESRLLFGKLSDASFRRNLKREKAFMKSYRNGRS